VWDTPDSVVEVERELAIALIGIADGGFSEQAAPPVSAKVAAEQAKAAAAAEATRVEANAAAEAAFDARQAQARVEVAPVTTLDEVDPAAKTAAGEATTDTATVPHGNAGRVAWLEHALGLGLHVDDSASKDDIKQLVADHTA
jgi:hypothetical protein